MFRPLASTLLLGTLIACGQSTPPPETPPPASTANVGSGATVASANVVVPPPDTSATPPADPEPPPDTTGGHHVGGTGKPPSIRQGAVSVNGRLPSEVIQRILRTHFGVFRKCYEAALQRAPKTEGRVAVKIVIGRDGKVSSAADGGSDVGDAQMVACIVDEIAKLNFPQPEGGIVTVVFPLIFQPPAP